MDSKLALHGIRLARFVARQSAPFSCNGPRAEHHRCRSRASIPTGGDSIAMDYFRL
jgi:hypothetical protein